MERHIHIHHHFPAGAELLGLLTSFLGELKSIKKELTHMEQELQRLSDDISGLTDVVGGAVTLLDKLAAMIAAIPTTDPATQAKITELANAVESTKQQLADAIVRDTPAAPAPVAPAA